MENTPGIEVAGRLESIFVPWSWAKRLEAFGNPKVGENATARFIHYTSAEAALKILKSKRMWMRNTTCMSDYREVQHGYDYINHTLQKDLEKDLLSALDACHPEIGPEVGKLFSGWWQTIRESSYITSISKHDDNEDEHGRLSMWRAFGGGNVARVGIVMSVPWASESMVDLKITAGPVAYLTQSQLKEQIEDVIKNIRRDTEWLKSLPRPVVVGSVFRMLLQHLLCLKHDGFVEEKEWRIIYSPKMEQSDLIKWTVETVNGVPQRVYNIPMDVGVSPQIADFDVAKLFDRLIVGPTQYSAAIKDAFIAALHDAGVVDAEKRVVCSRIPIRT
jgi:hypothetical protein